MSVLTPKRDSTDRESRAVETVKDEVRLHAACSSTPPRRTKPPHPPARYHSPPGRAARRGHEGLSSRRPPLLEDRSAGSAHLLHPALGSARLVPCKGGFQPDKKDWARSDRLHAVHSARPPVGSSRGTLRFENHGFRRRRATIPQAQIRRAARLVPKGKQLPQSHVAILRESVVVQGTLRRSRPRHAHSRRSCRACPP